MYSGLQSHRMFYYKYVPYQKKFLKFLIKNLLYHSTKCYTYKISNLLQAMSRHAKTHSITLRMVTRI